MWKASSQLSARIKADEQESVNAFLTQYQTTVGKEFSSFRDLILHMSENGLPTVEIPSIKDPNSISTIEISKEIDSYALSNHFTGTYEDKDVILHALANVPTQTPPHILLEDIETESTEYRSKTESASELDPLALVKHSLTNVSEPSETPELSENDLVITFPDGGSRELCKMINENRNKEYKRQRLEVRETLAETVINNFFNPFNLGFTDDRSSGFFVGSISQQTLDHLETIE